MKPTTTKDLTKLIALLRKNGVEMFEIDGFKLVLNPHIEPRRRRSHHQPQDPVIDSPFSEDDTLFWSSAGLPEEPN